MTSSDASSVSKLSLFCSLMLLGLPGIVAIAFLPSARLLGPDAELPIPEAQLRMSTLCNLTILLAVSVAIGVYLAPRVALKAPVIEALLSGKPVTTALKPQIVPAVFAGFFGAVMILVYGWYQMATVPEIVEKLKVAGGLPLLPRVLYGGINEEIMSRWGMMSLLVWLGWRLVQKGTGVPSSGVVWAGNVTAAVLFGVGHLPIACSHGLSTPLWMLIIVGSNALLGVAFGWLFWRKGLEAAMLAHALSHVFFVLVLEPIFTDDAEL